MHHPNARSKIVGRFVLWVHTKIAPSDEEWDSGIALMDPSTQKVAGLCTLVFTDGGAPDGSQRRRLSEVMGGRDMPIAVLSHALIPRFVNASISLFVKSIRSYNPEEFPLAIEYLKISEEEKGVLLPILLDLQREMGAERVQTLTRALKAAKWT